MIKHVRQGRRATPALAAVAAALAFALAACGDDPFAFDWDDTPDTVRIFSLARPELNIVTGFSFFDGEGISVEAPGASGQWDLALDTDPGDSQLYLLPPGALGISARGAVVRMDGATYEDVVEAPGDTAVYESSLPVLVASGSVYVVRTNRRTGSFGSTCVYYGKFEPVEIDLVEESLTFRYTTSPICNSRDLTPPD